MKITMVCFMLLFVYSCHDSSIPNDSKKTNRSEEVLKIMRKQSLHDYEMNISDSMHSEWDEEMLREIRKMKEDYYYLTDNDFLLSIPAPDWEIRGPMTVAEAEQEMLDEIISILGVPEIPIDFTDDYWDKFVSQCEEGDELYFYRSSSTSWGSLMGCEGYVIIRDNKLVAEIVTAMN